MFEPTRVYLFTMRTTKPPATNFFQAVARTLKGKYDRIELVFRDDILCEDRHYHFIGSEGDPAKLTKRDYEEITKKYFVEFWELDLNISEVGQVYRYCQNHSSDFILSNSKMINSVIPFDVNWIRLLAHFILDPGESGIGKLFWGLFGRQTQEVEGSATKKTEEHYCASLVAAALFWGLGEKRVGIKEEHIFKLTATELFLICRDTLGLTLVVRTSV